MIDPKGFGPYKDGVGRYRTLSLFFEYNKNAAEYTSPYSLKKHQLLSNPPSLYLRYMEIQDPTEYKFAQAVLGSWDHWNALCECAWFKPYIQDWREDLKVSLASKHYMEMRAMADSKVAKASDRITALRWLALNSGYDSTKSTKGRPSKEQVEGRLKQELRSLDEDKDDMERLGL
jgi:hypothetical protein